MSRKPWNASSRLGPVGPYTCCHFISHDLWVQTFEIWPNFELAWVKNEPQVCIEPISSTKLAERSPGKSSFVIIKTTLALEKTWKWKCLEIVHSSCDWVYPVDLRSLWSPWPERCLGNSPKTFTSLRLPTLRTSFESGIWASLALSHPLIRFHKSLFPSQLRHNPTAL